MSPMVALRCAAPALALGGSAAVWVMAGPFAAGLTLAVFLLGLATGELHRLRWSPVEPAAETPAGDFALFQLLDGGLAEAAEPEAPAASPARLRRTYRCSCDDLAIGSGRSNAALADRTRRHALAAAVEACRKREAALRAAARETPPPPALVFRRAYAARLTG